MASFGLGDDPVKRAGLRCPEKTLFELSVPCHYRQGVLIGNWVADRMECIAPKQPFLPPIQEKVTDSLDHKKVYLEARKESRQNKNKNQLGEVHNVITETEAIGNFVTTSDLIYNHLPKQVCEPEMKDKVHQRNIQEPNLLQRYPNLTHWGLSKFKKAEWDCHRAYDYITTLYDDTYTAPSQHQYLQPIERKSRQSSFTRSFNQ